MRTLVLKGTGWEAARRVGDVGCDAGCGDDAGRETGESLETGIGWECLLATGWNGCKIGSGCETALGLTVFLALGSSLYSLGIIKRDLSYSAPRSRQKATFLGLGVLGAGTGGSFLVFGSGISFAGGLGTGRLLAIGRLESKELYFCEEAGFGVFGGLACSGFGAICLGSSTFGVTSLDCSGSEVGTFHKDPSLAMLSILVNTDITSTSSLNAPSSTVRQVLIVLTDLLGTCPRNPPLSSSKD